MLPPITKLEGEVLHLKLRCGWGFRGLALSGSSGSREIKVTSLFLMEFDARGLKTQNRKNLEL